MLQLITKLLLTVGLGLTVRFFVLHAYVPGYLNVEEYTMFLNVTDISTVLFCLFTFILAL